MAATRFKSGPMLGLLASVLLIAACTSTPAAPTVAPTTAPKPTAAAAAPASPAASPGAASAASAPSPGASPAGSPVASPAASPVAAKPTGPATSNDPPATVVFGIISDSSNIWPLYVAQDKGFLAKENITLDIVQSPATVTSVQALLGGSLNFSLATADAVIAGAAKGGGARIVGGFGRGAAVLIAKPEIKEIEQLRGKTIGASALQAGEVPLLRAMLGSKGLKPDDYTIIVSGAPPARVAALQNGNVDAVMLTPPAEQLLLRNGFTNLGVSLTAMPDLAFVVLSVNSDWASKNPEVVVRTLRGLAAAMDWLLTPANKAEANKILADRLKLSAEDAEATWNYAIGGSAPLYYSRLRVTETSLKNAIAPLLESGAVTQQQADPKLYLDTSYLERAAP